MKKLDIILISKKAECLWPIYSFLTWPTEDSVVRRNALIALNNLYTTRHLLSFKSRLLCRVNRVLRIPRLSEMSCRLPHLTKINTNFDPFVMRSCPSFSPAGRACAAPPKPDHGFWYEHDHYLAEANTLFLACDPGYLPTSEGFITCHESGTWHNIGHTFCKGEGGFLFSSSSIT